MRAQPVRADEQRRLIMECRASGLTGHQWCVEHNIKPGTFYNWVKRLRKNGCAGMPGHPCLSPAPKKQEAVRIELAAPAGAGIQNAADPAAAPAGCHVQPILDPAKAALEVDLPEGRLRIPNGTDPGLLRQAFLMLKGIPCQATSQPPTRSALFAAYPHHVFILIFLIEHRFSAVFFRNYENKNLYAIMKSQYNRKDVIS